MTAFNPDPQTLFTVVAPMPGLNPAPMATSRRILPQPRPDYVAKHDLVDLIRRHPASFQGCLDGLIAQSLGGNAGQGSSERSDGSSRASG
jgi:hypothetical protein